MGGGRYYIDFLHVPRSAQRRGCPDPVQEAMKDAHRSIFSPKPVSMGVMKARGKKYMMGIHRRKSLLKKLSSIEEQIKLNRQSEGTYVQTETT